VADQQQNGDSKPLTDIELERFKIYQDSFKHMTTFCSGAILLSAAVTGALFPKPIIPGALAISIFLFSVGALFALLGLVFVPRYIDEAVGYRSTGFPDILGGMLWFSVGGAYSGLVSFGIFAVENLIPPPNIFKEADYRTHYRSLNFAEFYHHAVRPRLAVDYR
jgi:hypothetical protein